MSLFLVINLVHELITTATKATNLLEIFTGHARMTVNGLENHQNAYVSNQLIKKIYLSIDTTLDCIILTAIKCPVHYAPQYGYVNFTGYRPDNRAEYSCHAGYKLVGVPYRTCGYDGVWAGVIPRCIRKLFK